MKVRPQPVVGQPSWPGLSLSQPSTLPVLAPTVRSASDTATLLTREASSFDAALPLQGVNANFASAVFSPNWTAQAPNNSRLAFATYRFSTTGFTGLPTVSIVWGDGPADYSTYYVAVANRQQGNWDWFEGPIDNVITLPSLNAYKNAAGDMLVMVALTGTKQCTLSAVSVGPEETRGTGSNGFGTGGGAGGNNAPPLFGGTLPNSVDLGPQCSPIRNQGQLGSCTAFAIGSGALNYEMQRLYGNLGWNFGNTSEEIGPRYLYIETGKAQSLPCDATGRYYDQVVTWLMTNGISLEANAPYLPTPCDDVWGAAALGDAAVIKPAVGEAVACTTDEGITQVKTLLAQGRVVPVGTLLDEAFMNWTAGSAPWSYQGPQNGGHAMCIVGYDNAKAAFKVRNSWGEEWGEAGHIWIAYDSLKNTAAGAMCFRVEMEYSQALVNRLFGGGGNVFPPPTGVSATDGTQTDRVTVSWNAVTGATSYKVYRDSQATPVATVNAPTVSYDDMTAADGFSHTYWVKSVKVGAESEFSASDGGFVGGGGGSDPPIIYGLYYTEGNVGDAAQFYVDYYSADTPTFAWTLGGCNPGSSALESPTATYQSPGTQTISVTITNGGGSDTLSGDIFVGGGGTAPVASLLANPPSGTAPLSVTLDASGSTDDGPIYRYDWDWEGDGTFDYTSDLFSVISVDFPVGTWNVTCRVWDYDGMFGDAMRTVTVTGGGQGSYTETENNDDFALASAINFGFTDFGSCGTGNGYPGYDGDIDDVWGLQVTDTPLTFQVDMLLDSITGDLDLYLYDSFGNLGAWSENAGNAESIVITLNPGVYYIDVHGFSGFSDYELTYAAF